MSIIPQELYQSANRDSNLLAITCLLDFKIPTTPEHLVVVTTSGGSPAAGCRAQAITRGLPQEIGGPALLLGLGLGSQSLCYLSVVTIARSPEARRDVDLSLTCLV